MNQNTVPAPVIDSDPQLDRATCLALLATGSLGRLVFTHRALPDVLPVVYRLQGEDILIRLADGAIATRASRDAVVAFTVDEFDPGPRTGWSVTVVGQAHEILTPDARTSTALAGLTSWQHEGRSSVFRIAAEQIAGRRLVALP